jgi:hypothetical protein
MRISWGYKIAMLYVGFVALIVFMVSMAMRQKVDLVSKDYYEEELKFQDRIDKTNRANSLQQPLTWEINNEILSLKFPQQFKNKEISGSVYFFRPSDVTLDRTYAIPADTVSSRSLSLKDLKKGLYKMQINWEVNNEEYYNEGIIQVN